MWEFEHSLGERYALIAGVDEVGRGALFGDVVAACVLLPTDALIEGIADSKVLSSKKREQLDQCIREKAIGIGIGCVDVETIDAINIRQASRLAMRRAVDALPVSPDVLLVDYETIDLDIPQYAITHGDAVSHAIGAASIVAKVYRDRLCQEWHVQFPVFGIDRHKGYATTEHREAIILHGPTAMHRKSFLRKLLGDPDLLELPLGEEAI